VTSRAIVDDEEDECGVGRGASRLPCRSLDQPGAAVTLGGHPCPHPVNARDESDAPDNAIAGRNAVPAETAARAT
jgi:hypothetical protein